MDAPLLTSREKKIQELTDQNLTVREIGRKVECSYGRIQQIQQEMIARHGSNIFQRPRPILEISRELKKSSSKILQACTSLGIIPLMRPRKKGDIAFLGAVEIARVKDFLAQPVRGECVVCHNMFILPAPCTSPILICSSECRKIRKKQRHKRLSSGPPEKTQPDSWLKRFWEGKSREKPINNERWEPITVAVRESKLSKMQIQWLRQRQIISVQPDPQRTWRKKPIALYPIKLLRRAAAILRKHKKKQLASSAKGSKDQLSG